MASRLVLLVGSNPLPNYLSACALRPDRVTLVYTRETQEAMQRLRESLVAAQLEVSSEIMVDDATCPTDVRRKVDEALQGVAVNDAWLNYTGGTKVMAAHALMAFKDNGGLLANASYLDEGGPDRPPRLRFDDGRTEALTVERVPLTLKTILGLHGISYEQRRPKKPEPTAEDVTAILRKVLEDVSVARELYDERNRLKAYKNPAKAIDAPFLAKHHGLSLSQSVFPTQELLDQLSGSKERKAWFKQWYGFIGGEWLEEWLGAQIRALQLKPEPEIVVGVNSKRLAQSRPLEVDIAVVRGHRSYFISCTTDRKEFCKLKLFEVAVRARQLGGDLARAALVCLADNSTVSSLKQDIDDVWRATNTPRVFGLDDIRAWSGHDGAAANTTGLRDWLES